MIRDLSRVCLQIEMIWLPPKVFLDTQIVSDVERGTIPRDDWSAAVSYLREAARYCVSPLTVGELIYALVKGGEQHFEQHQNRLRILLSPSENAEVFDFINYFFANQFGLNVARPPQLEDDFLGSIRLILGAPSKKALLEGFSPKGSDPNQSVKVRIDRFCTEHERNREAYVKFMELRRAGGEFLIPPHQWASLWLDFYGIADGEVSISEVSNRLSAAYEFEMALNNLLKNPNFSTEKNKSDHVDGQQLFYLCDPTVAFITNDSDFKNRTRKSRQADQIKSFEELLIAAARGSALL